MDRKLLIQLLNMGGAALPEDANDAAVLAAVQKMTQSATLGSKAQEVLSALGLEASADLGAVKTKVAELKNPANFVSKADFDKLQKTQQAATVDKILAESKNIPEGQKDFAKTLLLQGLEKEQGIGMTADGKPEPGRVLFHTWYQSLPPISTRQLTGAGGGTPPKGNGSEEQHMDEITPEDEQWCQTIGYFRDERDKSGKVTMKATDRMAQMAEVTTSEALSWLFGQSISETEMDRLTREAREQQMARA